ncbi:MAG: TonB-dependent receptor, partial [Betaproteobacteria bacterium]|nr:TonB-dependent receptor [Betaproteobacteria bacterium]
MSIHKNTSVTFRPNYLSLLFPSLVASAQSDAKADAEAAAAPQPVKRLGVIEVSGSRPTALPAYIPTTIEGITGAQIEAAINATDAEDALKYFPSLLVRKRNIGDYDHAVLSSRATGTGNSARSLVYADGILLSNLLGNGASFTPRWSLVTPEEIDRVDVLYGPFSAAFSGNSVGAVVDYITRMPDKFEAHLKFGAFSQPFHLYHSDARYQGSQWSASLGDRAGKLAWWVNINRLENAGQPLTFATKVISTGQASTAGTPVTGAIFGQNPRNQDQWIIGAGTQTDTTQDHAKLKLAYEVSPTLRASYTFGLWRNDAFRNAESYLRDARGNPVFSGNVNIAGRLFTIAPTEITQSRADMEHQAHGLSIKQNSHGVWDWELAASLYDYHRDIVRTPTTALPTADSGGAGRIADQRGTGWITLALKGVWRPQGSSGAVGEHQVDLGLQQDHFKLRTLVSNTSNWIAGAPESRQSGFQGDTELTSLYLQDTWRMATAWRTTLGGRLERWRAYDGAIANATTTIGFAGRSQTTFSPKAAIAYQATPDWVVKASLGRAVRNPTVSELYQGSIAANVVINNDPNLRPEKSWTSEFSAERQLADGSLRATAFFEETRDALYSQTNVTVFPNVTNIQNVDKIRTEGVELAYQVSDWCLKGLDVTGSVTYAASLIDRNDKFPASVGKWQPRVPRWRSSLLLGYRASEAWSYSLGVRYAGRQFSQLDNSDPNGKAYTGASKFLVADVRAR